MSNSKLKKVFLSLFIAITIVIPVFLYAQENPQEDIELPIGDSVLEFTVTDQNGSANTHTNTLPPTQAGEPVQEEIYQFLQPLPGFDEGFNPEQDCAFGRYLDLMIGVFIGIAAVLAMVMIVVGGLQYMTSELVSSKQAGRERITHAILGLLLALGAYVILNEINPNLVNSLCLDNLPKASVAVQPEEGEITLGVGEDTLGLTACRQQDMKLINFLNGTQIQINKAVEGQFQAVLTNWETTLNGLKGNDPKSNEDKYTLSYEGTIKTIHSFSCKHVKDQPDKISAHAFGIAIDVKPGANPYNKDTCITDMPPKFVDAFTSAGFGWGGNWNSVYDPMHFSLAPNESQGSGTSTYQYLDGKDVITCGN